MSMSSHLVKRAIVLWKSGKRVEARKIFEASIYNDRQNEDAWIWYIYSLETNKEKIAALETFLSIFPHHAIGEKALKNLNAEELQYANLQTKVETKPLRTKNIRQAKLLPIQAVKPIQRSTPSLIPWVLVVLGICFILTSSTINASRYNSLQSENQILKDTNQTIARNYDQLSVEHQLVQSEYQTLQVTYGALQTEHKNLQDSYDSLKIDYNNLALSYEEFKYSAIAPPYIYTREREVLLVFKKLDGSLLKWTISSDWLEYHLRRGDELRNNLTYDLSLYNKYTDETYKVVDDRDFVDPTPFTNLLSDLYNESESDYAFIEEVWNIVAQLTAYTSEIQETPRFPMETLLSGGGDCEDHAILFASMILASPPPWEVKFIYMDGDNPTQPQTMNHVIVQVVTPDSPYLIEATSKENINPYGQEIYGWAYTIGRTDQ